MLTMASRLISFVFAGTFLVASSTAIARDVRPEEKLGTLVVELPKNLGKPGAHYVPEIQFTIEGTTANVAPGKVNNVRTGVGCLAIVDRVSQPYSVVLCGVGIEESKQTRIQLAAIEFSVDASQIETDFGPRPILSFETNEPGVTLKIQPKTVDEFEFGRQYTYVVPEMSLRLKFSNPELDYIHEKTFGLKRGVLLTEVLTPPEGRATIELNLVDGLSKFGEIPNNYIAAVYWNQPFRFGRTFSLVPSRVFSIAMGRGLNTDGLGSFYRFSNKEVQQSIRAFPLKLGSTGVYKFVVNEHEVPFALDAGKTTSIPVATIDVHSFKSMRDGEYQLVSNREDEKSFVGVQFVTRCAEDAYYRRFVCQFGPLSFRNQSSLFLPFGYKYRFDFFGTDDFGGRSLQDQVELDLPSSP